MLQSFAVTPCELVDGNGLNFFDCHLSDDVQLSSQHLLLVAPILLSHGISHIQIPVSWKLESHEKSWK